MIFVCFLLFLLFYLLLFSGKLSLDFMTFYNLNFEREKLLLKGSLRRLFNFKLLLL